MSDGQSATTTQASFTEQAVRDGHSIASVQMWQNLTKRLAVFGEDTESLTNVLLSLSDERGCSPLEICDDLIKNGIKKLDSTALEALIQLAQDGPPDCDDDEDDTEQYPPATQPMTPPVSVPSSPPTLKRKESFRGHRYLDLDAESEEL